MGSVARFRAADDEELDWFDRPYDEAVDFLLSKDVVTRDEFDSIEKWARPRAFTVTGITKLDVLQDVLDSLVDALQTGSTLEQFSANLDQILDGAGLDPLGAWRNETIFRTNVLSAYGRGNWEAGTDPTVASEIWGWRYLTVGDDRVREEHADLEDSVFKVGEGDQFFPPWDYNCRCSAEWITTAEAQEEGLEDSSEIPESAASASAESDFASPALSDVWDPDTSSYNPDAVYEYLKELSQGE